MSTVTGYDITAANYANRPGSGQIALYVTGSAGIIATAEMLADNPDAVRIDQSPTVTDIDTTADAYDVESGAITVAELPGILDQAIDNYATGARPGQRYPMVYVSSANLTSVANALTAAKLDDIPIWLADWTGDSATAIAAVESGSGPYPVTAYQYDNGTYYDVDIFSEDWLNAVSGTIPAPIAQNGWGFCSKCKGLVYSPENATSVCAAGGTHETPYASSYIIIYQE